MLSCELLSSHEEPNSCRWTLVIHVVSTQSLTHIVQMGLRQSLTDKIIQLEHEHDIQIDQTNDELYRNVNDVQRMHEAIEQLLTSQADSAKIIAQLRIHKEVA